MDRWLVSFYYKFMHFFPEGEEYEEEEGEWVSTSLEGNILEAMNLAINGK